MNDKEKIIAAGGVAATLGALAYYFTPKGGEEKKTEEVNTSETPDATTQQSGSTKSNGFDNVIIGDIGGTNVRF
jgi:hypothetical protein